VRGRFAYLLGAAKRGILKVDWLNLLVGQIVSLVTEGVLDASLWHPVMSHAHKILNGIFQFGVRLLK
jgi:hypothetical protein